MRFHRAGKAVVVIGLAIAALCIAACNTVEGVGKDVERGGEKLQGAAK